MRDQDTLRSPRVPHSVRTPSWQCEAPPRLLDRLHDALRVRHYAIRTEQAYVDWARRYILFHGKRHPANLGADAVAAFLTHLEVERTVAPSTQNQAKAALLFLYRQVLGVKLPWLDEIVAAKDTQRLPVMLTTAEVRALLHELSGTMGLVASLFYGTGMRLLEGLRLRVKDVEFERRELLVRHGKGGKDRVTYRAAREPGAAAARPDRACPCGARSRPRGGLRRGLAARRARYQVFAGRAELGLAVGVPECSAQPRSALGGVGR